jgi:hypothetical protein
MPAIPVGVQFMGVGWKSEKAVTYGPDKRYGTLKGFFGRLLGKGATHRIRASEWRQWGLWGSLRLATVKTVPSFKLEGQGKVLSNPVWVTALTEPIQRELGLSLEFQPLLIPGLGLKWQGCRWGGKQNKKENEKSNPHAHLWSAGVSHWLTPIRSSRAGEQVTQWVVAIP